jgi:hypothetical protein
MKKPPMSSTGSRLSRSEPTKPSVWLASSTRYLIARDGFAALYSSSVRTNVSSRSGSVAWIFDLSLSSRLTLLPWIVTVVTRPAWIFDFASLRSTIVAAGDCER